MRCALFYDNPVSHRLRVHRELSPRRSRGAGAAAPDRRAAPVRGLRRAPRRRPTRARAGCSPPPIDAAAYPRDVELGRLRLLRPARRAGRHRAAAAVPAPHADARRARARSRRRAGGRTRAAGRRLRLAAAVRVAPTGPNGPRPPTTRSCRPARCSSNRCAVSRTTRSPSTASRSAGHLPAAVHHRLRLGFDAVGCCRRCSCADRPRAVRASPPPTGAAARPPHRRRRLAVAALRGSGSSRSPSSTSWRAASRTIRRWCT